MKIDKIFFKKYQRQILWLANTWIGKYVFQFEKMGHELRNGKKIDRITPNSIRYKNKDNSYTEQFFGRNEYALKLAPLVWWLPIELFEEGLNGGKALLKPAYQLVLLALFLKLPKGVPLMSLTTTDFYPDADPESTSVDGVVGNQVANQTWADLHDAETGNYFNDDNIGTGSATLMIERGTTGWSVLRRGFFLFDTSALTSAVTISAATFSVRGTSKGDDVDISPTFNVYSSNPASNTGLGTADFDALGTTAFSDTAITYANYSISAYNSWLLNSTGRTAISKTSITKFGTRFVCDAADAEPGSPSVGYTQARCYMADNGSLKPTLSVTYAPPATDVPVSEQALALTLQSPTINFDYLLALSEQALVLAQQDTSIVIGRVVLLSALQLVLEQQTPTTNYDYSVVLSELKLVLDEKDPTASISTSISLSSLGLEINNIDPDIIWNACVELSELALEAGIYDPLLRYWARQTKHTASWTNSSKSSAPSWTNLTKHTQ